LGFSPFVAEQCTRRPDLLFDLMASGRLLRAPKEGECRALLSSALEGATDETSLMAALRSFRNQEMVRIAWRDIMNGASLEETLSDLTNLAEEIVSQTLEQLFAFAVERFGTPLNERGEPQNLIVLGMGKLGAFELNFSSDIDLIFAFRRNGSLDDRKQTSYGEFYTRLAQRLVKVLDAPTEDGFVFRVDTRLRPFGDSGPLVMSFEALEAYYQSQAREWERYAMVKARTIAGDLQGGRDLEAFLKPFVYRRYLDFRALGELRDIKHKISQELRRKDRKDNVKLGPGGIREIEFIAQAFQLIRGGQVKILQQREVQKVLPALSALGLLSQDVVNTLMSAYTTLRRVENRLQQRADEQTHDLPVDEIAREALAVVLGHPNFETFKRSLDATREAVHGIFREVIGEPDELDSPDLLGAHKDDLTRSLFAYGFKPSEAVALSLESFGHRPIIQNVLRVAAADLFGLLPLMVVSDDLTFIAETLLKRCLAEAFQSTVHQYGLPMGATTILNAGFGVIAYGKLGGLELGYGSDLDLVFLYQGDGLSMTQGENPKSLAEFFARLAKRIIHLVSTNTPSGILYETDLRLRPSGNSGLLVSRLEAFESYQMESAWTWEQQALVKARFISGDPSVREAFERIRHTSLRRPRAIDALKEDIKTMREKMRASQSLHDPLRFHLKHDAGGIVDIEFLVQFGVLSKAHLDPDLTEWTDVVRLLERLAASGFLSQDDAQFLKETYCTFRRRVHRLALEDVPTSVPATEYRAHRARVMDLWQTLMG
ncbi:MAG: bifunctional [glutamate--ammonia ligase]-adenylyl-L-tyrosine phosphorylase/[glutamate--ammonia-ligase] adenylyltransferase, partial [Gammaproteobacteria bacterium]|nr:bifunctional [glutamate--ammonia ligase]-adenylyl-L-tyrosine phosphorylase/[glutamate--ammonia-ligase] adenylyltransferase [Gammaproteobacteria bacterium]